jgi:hypothetical protein
MTTPTLMVARNFQLSITWPNDGIEKACGPIKSRFWFEEMSLGANRLIRKSYLGVYDYNCLG